MLTINHTDIILSQVANSKTEAIQSVASSLTGKGYIEPEYVSGMLAREKQSSTYLGNGIAIPHGTTDTRNMVNNTGVILHHYPEGVDWGDGNRVYLAIGIAAKSDEHLSILTQLTKVLSNDSVELLLKNATKAEEIVALLSGQQQSETLFDADLVALNMPISDINQLAASACALIKNKGAVDENFVIDAIKNVTYLGQGLCLIASSEGIAKTALSFVSSETPLAFKNDSVKGLLCIASNNQLHLKNLDYLIDLLYQNKIEELLCASEKDVIRLLTEDKVEGLQQVFTIKNPHGLHARPGGVLVSVAKKFKSKIQMTNLDGNGKTENAKSLMKVMTQGIKFGNRLQFNAQGEDAEQALTAIGKAIDEGLGEK